MAQHPTTRTDKPAVESNAATRRKAPRKKAPKSGLTCPAIFGPAEA